MILLSLLPVLLAGGLASGLAWYYWEGAVDAVRVTLEQTALIAPAMLWLNQISGGMFRSVVGPLVVVLVAAPLLLILSMLLVSAFMTGAIVRLVARRRFPSLERRYGGRWWQSLLWSVGGTLVALVALVLSMPFWLLPPLALLLPPLIWGWLSYRVMSYDALAEHASAEERQQLMKEHRWPLFSIGMITGYLGAAPSLVWASGAILLPMVPLLLPVFVWLYTLVFAFAALWYTHYGLAALEVQRKKRKAAVPASPLQPVSSSPAALPGSGGPAALPSVANGR
ncbi:EI24 domain-containing protein [Sphaerotilus hippei]|uniref:EI24 domain-containing protein n=1 Tax=Sphaerotilus hippei TaxID=744406 RepID=UPI001FE8F36E